MINRAPRGQERTSVYNQREKCMEQQQRYSAIEIRATAVRIEIRFSVFTFEYI